MRVVVGQSAAVLVVVVNAVVAIVVVIVAVVDLVVITGIIVSTVSIVCGTIVLDDITLRSNAVVLNPGFDGNTWHFRNLGLTAMNISVAGVVAVMSDAIVDDMVVVVTGGIVLDMVVALNSLIVESVVVGIVVGVVVSPCRSRVGAR